jgi:hypothetical protein
MNYEEKTYLELLAYCREQKLKGYSGKKKAELITLIVEAQKPTSPPAAKQDTGKFRQNTKDQFYTSPVVAAACIEQIQKHIPGVEHYRWIEPSAGAGAFLAPLPASYDVVALDIEPAATSQAGPPITTADFLQWTQPEAETKSLVFGNPPFGRQASTAKAFIKKSCEFAAAIAFILPLSFTKPSMARAFDAHFHCIYEEALGKDAFLLNGEPYDVPCVFQIWERREAEREADTKVEAEGFTYVKGGVPYTFALRRVGVYAGHAYPHDGTSYSVQSHYFIQVDPKKKLGKKQVERTIGMMNGHVFPSNTVGPRSLSKSEVNVVLNAVLAEVTSS